MAGELDRCVSACDALAEVAERHGLVEATVEWSGVKIAFKRLPLSPESLIGDMGSGAGPSKAMTLLERIAAGNDDADDQG